MKAARHIIATAVLASLGCAGVLAAPVMYADRAAYLAATSGNTTIDFEAQNPGGDSTYTYEGTSLTIGNATFHQPNGRMFVFGDRFYPTLGLTSSYLNQNCCAANGLQITFVDPVHALALDYGLQNTWNSGALDISFTLSSGEVINRLGKVFLGTQEKMDFLGFSSDVGITSINIQDPAQGLALDNISYTRNSANAVPEPGTIALTGLALLGLYAVRRRAAR